VSELTKTLWAQVREFIVLVLLMVRNVFCVKLIVLVLLVVRNVQCVMFIMSVPAYGTKRRVYKFYCVSPAYGTKCTECTVYNNFYENVLAL
jgi:hypothetical protein